MKMYSYEYAKGVVDCFLEVHTRGVARVKKYTSALDAETVTGLFMYNQRRWNIYKKLVKLMERLSASDTYKVDEALLYKNYLTHVDYFKEAKEIT